jgi:ABC-type antimicrobial peptide transport system permease subunit
MKNKKRLTINTLALGNLKQRKKQYTIMIIGIILAMVFSSSILFFISSANDTLFEKNYHKYGKQDCIVSVDGNDDFYTKAKSDNIVSDYGFAHIIGFAYVDDEYDSIEPDINFCGTAIGWLDDKAMDISNLTLLEGVYPTNQNEIAIEKSSLERMNIDSQIGDEITLRVNIQSGNDYYKIVEKTYKLVGIVEDKKINIQQYEGSMLSQNAIIPSAFVAQNTNVDLGGKERIVGYINSFSGVKQNDIFSYLMKNSKSFEFIDASAKNAFSVTSFFSISTNSAFILVLALVLMFASCVAVVNAFNSNLKSRKQQIGMLRAVGATKRQIINIFGREAFIISAICTPISIAISYILVRILLTVVADEFVMSKSIWVIPLCAVFGIVVVMLSALIPLNSASKITPMQVIRNINQNRQMKLKHIKSQKYFDTASLLAKRNLTFNNGSRIAVSIMLIITITLSCYAMSFVQYQKNEKVSLQTSDYYLYNMNGTSDELCNYDNWNDGLTDNEKAEIDSLPYVKSSHGQKSSSTLLSVDGFTDYYKSFENQIEKVFVTGDTRNSLEKYEENYCDEYDEEYLKIKSALKSETELFPTKITSNSSDSVKNLEKYLSEGEINIDALNLGEEIILVAPQKISLIADKINDSDYSFYYSYDENNDDYNSTNSEVFLSGECPYQVGDYVDLTVANCKSIDNFNENPNSINYKSNKVRIGAIISPDKLNSDFENFNEFSFITTTKGMDNFATNLRYSDLSVDLNIDITSSQMNNDIDKQVVEKLQSYANLHDGDIRSNYDLINENESYFNLLLTSIISIFIVAFSICVSIINNTITARIRENKRQLGTLRAFGAEERELVKSYLKELASMLSWGVGIGFSLFLILYGVMFAIYKYESVTIKNYDGSFELVFNPWLTIAMIVVMFAICSINLWSKIRKEMKNSIVENIREL